MRMRLVGFVVAIDGWSVYLTGAFFRPRGSAQGPGELAVQVRDKPGLINFAIRNRAHLLPCAMLVLWALPPWYGSRPSFIAAPMIFLVGFGIYQLNRVCDVVEDRINDPQAYEKTFPHAGLLRNAAVAAIIASLVLSAVFMSLAATILLAVILVAGILYSVPFLRQRRASPRRLKQIVGMKNVIPSAVWPMTTILYPAIAIPGARSLQLVLTCAVLACGVFTIEVAWDVRDARGDRVAGISTLATSLGPARALLVPLAVACVLAVAIASGVYAGSLTTAWLLPAILLIMLSAIAYLWKDSIARNRDRSHILVLLNMSALIPLGLVGRWGV